MLAYLLKYMVVGIVFAVEAKVTGIVVEIQEQKPTSATTCSSGFIFTNDTTPGCLVVV